jgi:hypothetical protein
MAFALCATVLLMFVAAAGPQSAGASGGSIESSTYVAAGQQQFGNTGNGTFKCGPADFWRLQLIAGDVATVDWETSQADFANELFVYGAGTTDFSINNDDPQNQFSIGDNNRAESIFTAGTSGAYPLIFTGRGCNGDQNNHGPYDFTVAVSHRAVLALGPVGSLKRRTGTVTVGVHTPDGSPITEPALQVDLRGTWRGHSHLLASGSPSNGSVTFNVTLPAGTRGRAVGIQAKAHGPGYQSSQTRSKRVNVHG